MNALLSASQLLVSLLFILLGILAFREWLTERETSRGWLALAVGSLGAISLLGRVTTAIPDALTAEIVGDISVAIFLLSGYALLRFRGTFIPLRRTTNAIALGLLIAAVLLAVATRLAAPAGTAASAQTPAALKGAATILLVAFWAACLLDPIIRFALASRKRPAVQSARLRSLSVGFALLVIILFTSAAAPTLLASQGAKLATEVIALLSVPFIYASLSPPVWLRRTWRDRETEALRNAVRDLILFSPSRQVLAERALEWAQRLVGADAAMIADSDGSALAAHGVWPESVKGLLKDLEREPAGRIVRLTDAERPGSAMILPLPLSAGTGALIVLSGPYTPYFGSDELQGLIGYATSITAALDRSILTERITALERTKTEFLNLASHELRGPITLIRGYLDMVATGALGPVSKELRRVLPALQIKAEEMNGLIEQMIEAARLEEGRLELHPVDTDLRELAKTAVEVIAPLTKREHALRVETPAQEVRANVDPERVGTILANLLSNAIKYSPHGGEIRCAVTKEDGMAVVEVTDHGVGIAPEEMDKLFTRFGRIANQETRHISGTGLGLYLSRQLARMHGGDVTVRSTPGKGSTFRLAVPLTHTTC